MRTFVPLVGQFDNLGDVFLRRHLASWLPHDAHVLVGSASPDFVSSLELPSTATLYTSLRSWATAMAIDRTRGSYVYKPGEIQMSAPGMKEHVGLLPLITRLAAAGGHVGRVGVGTRSVSRPYVALCRPSVALSDVTVWRDADTRQAFGRGTVAPDLAFAEGSREQDWGTENRSMLVVSLRGDSPMPSVTWFDALSRFAATRGLGVTAVSQVRRDDHRTRECATVLRCPAICMEDLAFDRVEDAVRTLYRRSTLVVSDRLHVLVGAATEGAPVSAALEGGSAKIGRHFDVVGLADIAADVSAASPDQRVAAFARAADDIAVVHESVSRARRDLEWTRSTFSVAMGFPA